ncbi:MAG: EAL domain-containing protein [Gemmatimonadetes bacterium]|nr:EAL domain-containing protein [Gemmatimonadota bacterium]
MASEPIRTLVVEDEPSARHLIQEILQARGHDVEACADAETAWEIAQRERFSLAVLDLRLPGMDGVELCRRLRKLPDGGQMVVMFVTGADRLEDLGRALEAGADDYVLKPIVDADLPVRFALAERKIYFLQDRKRTEEGLARDALRDSVTDLVNRTLFTERLHRTARRAQRKNQMPGQVTKYLYAVLFVNLDGFAQVNSRVGYEGGNEILRQVGNRLEDCIRGADTVARFGGDEFAILLDDMKDVSDPTRVCRRIDQAFSKPFRGGGEDFRLTACVGVALSFGSAVDSAAIVDEARKALIRAKEEGPASVVMFDAVVHARAIARVQLESRLRSAVENGEMVLHYQPITLLETGKVEGFEALVRWNEPDRGIVGPNEFIRVAEDTGVIIPLGRWIIDEALRQLSEWREALPEGELPFVSVNVSGRQFTLPDLAEQITRSMDEAGLPEGSVHIEITETALMTDLDTARRTIQLLNEASVEVHVDDFGTGYSSLSYLSRLPISGLKIDRSFVSQITNSREDREVVRTITSLGKSLHMAVIAEGVETERQHEELRALGCQYGQGFLFGRPRPADELTKFFHGREARA